MRHNGRYIKIDIFSYCPTFLPYSLFSTEIKHYFFSLITDDDACHGLNHKCTSATKTATTPSLLPDFAVTRSVFEGSRIIWNVS